MYSFSKEYGLSDAFIAVQRIAELRGGCVCVQDGVILGELPLPVAGLLSLEDVNTTAQAIVQYNTTLKKHFGIKHHSPIMRTFFYDSSRYTLHKNYRYGVY